VRKGEVELEAPAEPLKRDMSSDLSVVGVEVYLNSSAEERVLVVAVADIVDIFGATPCEGTRLRSRFVICCASGVEFRRLCLSASCVQSFDPVRDLEGEAAGLCDCELETLAGGFAELRPDD
jgi:hypothetical protein